MRTLALTTLLLVAAHARAAEPAAGFGGTRESVGSAAATPYHLGTLALAAQNDVAAAAPQSSDRAIPKLGLALDAGVPAGAALSLHYRPWWPIRLRAGPAWDYVAWGVQGGVDLIPITWAITPVFSFEAGHYFDANLSKFVKSSSGTAHDMSPLLRKVSYDYAAALFGLELGSQRGFAFSLRAGLAYLKLGAKGRADSTSTNSDGTTVYLVDPKLRGTLPCVKLGFQYAF